MKRIISACLLETIHFQIKDGLEREDAEKLVAEELTRFKLDLSRTRTRYVIEDQQAQADGSVVLKIRKQYNQYKVGEYLG